MTVAPLRGRVGGPAAVPRAPGDDRPGAVLDDRRDAVALPGLALLVVAAHLVTHRDGVLVGMDVATQFIPWYGWLGEQLATGAIPQWNPSVFAGMPSAGDPLSGWGYLPVMLPFGLLDLAPAVHIYLIAQLLLIAVGTYVLARSLRLPVAAAVAAAVTATFNGFVFQRNMCCVAFVSVEAWIPWLLLGLDRALVTRGVRRVGAWAVAGVALSQIAGGWLGQGTLYVLILATAWLTGRALLAERPWRDRVRTLALNAGVLTLLGLGLSAPVVWPRLQVNPTTNLAGGYPGQSITSWHGGWAPTDWIELVRPGIWHVGALPLALAVVALFIARRDRLTWLLGGIVAGALILTLPMVTPLNAPLLALPGVDRVLTHAPQRAVLIAHPTIALLVGVTVARLRVPRVAPRMVAVALIAVLAAELTIANVLEIGRALEAERNPDLLRRIDVASFYEPSAAGAFLQRERDRGRIGRYAAFTPVARDDGSVVSASYFFFWQYPSVQAIEAHNEGMLLGLEHVQGYNPIHVARFDDLITAGNGRGQDHHVANLFPVAFDRGAFDLLNGRWVVLNRSIDHRDPGLVGERMATWPQVFADRRVRVLENPDALPRTWLVHDARRVAPGDALDLITAGDVDPRTTALLTGAPPPLDPDGGGTAEVVGRTTDSLDIAVDASGDALLVVSEIHHPLWRATIDGRPADVVVVDDVLRGVAVPAGLHRIVLHTDDAVLHVGLAVALATALALAAAGVHLAHRARRV
ncbi:MAG TPA: hypothetical protein VFZ70_14975 [Euzebyales bacterium]